MINNTHGVQLNRFDNLPSPFILPWLPYEFLKKFSKVDAS
jgi:hypothetical protein